MVPAVEFEIGNRQRDALAALVHAHDHELTRFGLASHQRGLDNNQLNSWNSGFVFQE